jgi:hypothetical protein
VSEGGVIVVTVEGYYVDVVGRHGGNTCNQGDAAKYPTVRVLITLSAGREGKINIELGNFR